MSKSATKGRKRRRFGDLDDSQRSIRLFCINNTTPNKLRAAGISGEKSADCVQRKRQTLLAPFNKTSNPNCFKIRKMDSWADGENAEKSQSFAGIVGNDVKIGSNYASASNEVESDSELIECCDRAELSLSQEKLKQSKANVRSSRNEGNLSQIEDLIDGSDSEIEIIECCEKVELSWSQEKAKCTKEACESRAKVAAARRQLLSQYDEDIGLNVKGSHKKEPGKCKPRDDFESELNDLLAASQPSSASLKGSDKKKRDSPNRFGLFGITSSDEEEMDACFDQEMDKYKQRDYFAEIPDEILEIVFCQLPLIDLLTNLSRVCKRWHRVISGEKFLLWKKRYYRYKCDYESRQEIDELIVTEELHVPSVFPDRLWK